MYIALILFETQALMNDALSRNKHITCLRITVSVLPFNFSMRSSKKRRIGKVHIPVVKEGEMHGGLSFFPNHTFIASFLVEKLVEKG